MLDQSPNTFYCVSGGSPTKHIYYAGYARDVERPLIDDPISTLASYSAAAKTIGAAGHLGAGPDSSKRLSLAGSAHYSLAHLQNNPALCAVVNDQKPRSNVGGNWSF